MRRTLWALILMALAVPGWPQNYEEGDDPEHGVARLSLLSGDVSVQRGDTGEVVAGELNAPLVALDHVLTGSGSRAEVQFDWATMIRLGPASEIRLGELSDGNYLVQVAEGTTTFRILQDTKAQVEISTPTVSVRPVQKGIYRITVRPDGITEVTVRDGRAEIFTPRGSETLREGKTMEARGTASDPEFMIANARGKDDWDRWNEDRDRDLDRAQDNYRYVSSSIPGAYDLNGHGRWVYDSPYGWVWVPNAAPGWAPYRVGRWSWVNYYGWTWISGDPWGWAPYHYGNWYSSPYGWAWYPGALGYRYYWRPALVGFFGWGSPGVSIGIGIGTGWGYGNIGWVPLAPYERFRPWYGRGFNNRTVVNNVTIVNNTNITNVYRNARVFNGRNGVTSIEANNFGRQRVNTDNFVRAGNSDLTRVGQVQGQIPVNADRDSRRFNDRSPGQETATRATRERPVQFATAGTTAVGGNRGGARGTNDVAGQPGRPVEGSVRGNDRGAAERGAGAVDRANVERGGVDRGTAVDRGNGNVDRGSRGAVTAREPQDRGAINNPASSGGWRRFDPSTANTSPDRGGFSTRPNNAGSTNGRQATEITPRQNEPRSDRGGFADRRGVFDRTPQQPQGQPQSIEPRGSDPGFGSRRNGGQQPVQINPPIVQDRGNRGNIGGGSGGGVMRQAPSGNIGGGRSIERSAPSAPSMPSGPPAGMGTIRGGGGGAPSGARGAAPQGNIGGGGGGGTAGGGGDRGRRR